MRMVTSGVLDDNTYSKPTKITGSTLDVMPNPNNDVVKISQFTLVYILFKILLFKSKK